MSASARPIGVGLAAVDTVYDKGAVEIEALGYLPVESAFLCRVAKAGGYFLRRQFFAFSGQQVGHGVVDFTRRLERRRHATALCLRRGTRVYHLSSRALYQAANCEDRKRARRTRPDVSVKVRLMALDVVLGYPDMAFLATPEERLAWLTELLFTEYCLPTRTFKAGANATLTTRAFVENVMVCVPTGASTAESPLFVYLDAGPAPVLGFAGFLRRYESLLARVGGWRLIHVSDAPRHAVKAEREYAHWAGFNESDPQVAHARSEELLKYFRLREAYSAERWRDFTTDTFNWFLDIRRRLHGQADGLYARWLCGGDGVVWDTLAEGGLPATNTGTFEAVVLPYSYPFEATR